MCTQSIEWNLLLFGLLHSNVSNFYSRYWVWFTHDWHFILLNMCSHCGFNVLLNIFSWAYSTFFAVCFIVGRYNKCICCTVGKSILRLNHVSLVSYEKRVRLELRQEFWIKLNTGLTRALILLLLYITSPPLWLKGNMQFNDILYCW